MAGNRPDEGQGESGRVSRPQSAMDDLNLHPEERTVLGGYAELVARIDKIEAKVRRLERRESRKEREIRVVSSEARKAQIKSWEDRKKITRDKARKRRATPGNHDSENRKKVLAALKIEVLTRYSRNQILSCSCPGCTVTNVEFLSLDHIAGNGSAHRSPSGRRLSGSTLYTAVKDEGYPTGYATLCLWCNFSKRKSPACKRAGKSHAGHESTGE